MTGAREIERKYDVPEGAALPSLTGVLPGFTAGEPHTFEMSATYLDTADHALSTARTALRRREGGHDAGWHIKVSTQEGRFETQWPLDSPVSASATSVAPSDAEIPDVVRAELASRFGLADAGFAPIAVLRTTRTTVILRDAEGRDRVEIADDTVVALDVAAGITSTWREWEAEFLPLPGTDGNGAAAEAEATSLLNVVEIHLRAAGAVHAAFGSKLGRTLRR